ncbi:hypothetical protein CLOM_g20698 [Closterium sp. NIES-68]|nr:hypothetical protein CLOM_g20698 [Closterium sp. NIES-68]GJP82404.1 hypothetical protein CLOP_g12667 [Closterium sp. NIES-67]
MMTWVRRRPALGLFLLVSTVLSSLPNLGHSPYATLLASAQPIISQVVAGTDGNFAVQITVRDVAGAVAADVADLRLVWSNGTAIWEGKEYGDRWRLLPGVTITLCHGGGSLILERLCDVVVESLRFGPYVSFNLLWQPPDRAPTRDIFGKSPLRTKSSASPGGAAVVAAAASGGESSRVLWWGIDSKAEHSNRGRTAVRSAHAASPMVNWTAPERDWTLLPANLMLSGGVVLNLAVCSAAGCAKIPSFPLSPCGPTGPAASPVDSSRTMSFGLWSFDSRPMPCRGTCPTLDTLLRRGSPFIRKSRVHVWALTGLTACNTVQQLADQASSATFPKFGRYRAYHVAEQPSPARLNESWRSLPLSLMSLHAPLGALPLQSTVESEHYPIPDSACGLPDGQAGKTPPPTHFVSHFNVAGVRFAVVGVYLVLGVSFRGSLPCAIREAQAVAMARVVRRLLLRGEEVVVMGTFNDLDGDLSADLAMENLDPVSRVMQIIKDATSERLINVAAALPSEKRQTAALQTNFILISQHLTDAISVEMPHVKGMPYNPVILKLRLQQRHYRTPSPPPHSPSSPTQLPKSPTHNSPSSVIQEPRSGLNSSHSARSDGSSNSSRGSSGGSSNSSRGSSGGSSRHGSRVDGSRPNTTTTTTATTSNSSSPVSAGGNSSSSTASSNATSASAPASTTAAAAPADSSSRVGAGEHDASADSSSSDGSSSNEDSQGLSGGAVAAIVFFVIIGLAIGAAAAFWWLGGAKLLQKESFKRKGMNMFVVGVGPHWKLGKKKGHGGGGGGDGDAGSENGGLAKEEGGGYGGDDSGKDGEAGGAKPKKKSFMSGYKVWKPMDASRFVPSRPVMAPPFQSFLTSQPGSPIIDNPVPLSRRAGWDDNDDDNDDDNWSPPRFALLEPRTGLREYS